MKPNRTFGIEIECLSNITREELANLLNESFQQEFGGAHRAITEDYHHNTDGRNFAIWSVKPDGSIRTDSTHQYKAEIVSPVLKGNDGLAVLKVVCETIAPYVKVNKSCGLHVHHGILPEDNLGNIIIGWLRSEEAWYNCLPPSRRQGTYAKKLGETASNKGGQPIYQRVFRGGRRRTGTTPQWEMPINIDGDIRSWWRNWINTRYVGLNLESYWLRGTVEIRAAAGTTEFEKIAAWAEVTQQFICQASKAALSFSGSIDGLIGALLGSVKEQIIEPTGWVSPKQTRFFALYEMIVDKGEHSRSDLEQACLQSFPNVTIVTIKTYIADFVALAKKKGANVNVTRQTIKISNRKEIILFNDTVVEDDPMVLRATEWLRARYTKFQGGI